MKISVIIATKDRLDDLLQCLSSIAVQTVKPDEIVIVDSGSTAGAREKIARHLNSSGIRSVYLKSAPSLTAQRNRGVRAAGGDILFFLDDDVILDKDYIENILQVYAAKQEQNVGGVQGVVKNARHYECFRSFFNRAFLLDNSVISGKSRAYPSGNFLINVSPRAVTKAVVMVGCNMSFRKEVFTDFQFDERLSGYAPREDYDFSYRVAGKSNLFVTPHARIIHKTSPVASDRSGRNVTKQRMTNRYYVFKKNFDKNAMSKISFYWSLVGWILLALWHTIRWRNLGHIVGAITGIININSLLSLPDSR